MDSMYQQIILDHYKNPHHRGLPDDFDAEVHHVNPTCGDEVTLRVAVRDGRARAISAGTGEGCSISQASTSVMSDLVIGKPVAEALELSGRFLELMQSRGEVELTEDEADELDDAVAFEGVSKYPARVKCALLGWMAMKGAVAQAGRPHRQTEHVMTEDVPAQPRRGRGGDARRRRPRARHQRRRPRPGLRRPHRPGGRGDRRPWSSRST